jgi:hypothetical protein
MKFHLPSLQAAAHIASASQKERYPLRLVQVVRRPGGGHRYLATCDGHIAIACDHRCEQTVSVTRAGTYATEQHRVPLEDTKLPEGVVTLIWADSVPKRKPTQREIADDSAWIPESDLQTWRILDGDTRLEMLPGDRIPGDPHTSTLREIPRLHKLLREFVPGNYVAGTSARVNGRYLGLLSRASELLARAVLVKSIHGDLYGDTPSLEFFTDHPLEGAPVLVDLTAQRWDDPDAFTAWAQLMPIQRRREGIRGKQSLAAVA